MNNSHLRRIQDWPQLAHDESYSVSAIAQACGVSVRVLERFFLATMDDTPSRWLQRLRMENALELLRDGCNVNQTADRLGYHDHSHFSREFKRYYAFPPKEYERVRAKGSPKRQLSHLATQLSH